MPAIGCWRYTRYRQSAQAASQDSFHHQCAATRTANRQIVGGPCHNDRTIVPFSNLELHPSLRRGIRDLGFARPTPIQTEAVPPGLAGRDVLACAMTGSGKTAAFLWPIMHQLLAHPRRAQTLRF